MKNIKDIQELFLSSPKTDDSLIIPIGYDNKSTKELSFSCRGTIRRRDGNIGIGNQNGYCIICNIAEEGTNLISGLIVNLCRKYSPKEALISYYNYSDTPQHNFSFIRNLPNANRINDICFKEQFEEEIQRLKECYDSRYRQISQYGDCYARAVTAAKKNGEILPLPQEILVFHFSQYTYSLDNSMQFEKHIRFLTQHLWRVGIYPVALFEKNSNYNEFNRSTRYFGGEIILPSSQNIRNIAHKLKSGEVLLSTGWDSWDWSAEGQEVFNIPHYDEEWILNNIRILEESK